MANLSSKIANSYTKPSPNEMEFFDVIDTRFKAAKENYAQLKKGAKVDLSGLKTFEAFINE